MKRHLVCLALVAVFGCGGATTAYTPTGPTLAAQPDSCDFAVASSPIKGSTELGTIDIKYMKQTDWIYDEKAFKRKVRTQVCRAGGDAVVAHINDNGLYMSATVLTTKAPPAPATEAPAAAPAEPETTAEATPVAAAPAAAAAADKSAPAAAGKSAPGAAGKSAPAATDKSAQAAAKPEKKADGAKDDEAIKAVQGKKGNKKGASAKKDQDVRGKDGKIDIDKLL